MALDALDTLFERWDKKYPKISQSWRDNWPNLSTYFKYPQEVRRLIYTTNTIAGLNWQLRKVTKAKWSVITFWHVLHDAALPYDGTPVFLFANVKKAFAKAKDCK